MVVLSLSFISVTSVKLWHEKRHIFIVLPIRKAAKMFLSTAKG
jgi:hypothetical protein